MAEAGAHRFGVLLLVLAWLACGREPEPPPVPLARVEVAIVRVGTIDETVSGVGSVDSVSSVPIRAQMAGRIERLHFTEGDSVESGELLVTIDDAELGEQGDALRASLRSARARAQETSRTLARIEPLHERGIVPEQELDEARSAADAARAEVGRIEAELRGLDERRAFARVRAPFSGQLREREVNPGDTVQIGDPLVTLVRPGALEVNLWLAQRDAGRVERGMPVQVRLATAPDQALTGQLVFVSPEIEAASRTLLVKAALDEDGAHELTPGLSASGSIVVGRRTGPLVPERALVGTREGYIVFVVSDDRVQARPVQVGLREPGRVLIEQGVAEGELVVERGQQRVSDGDRVEIVERHELALANLHDASRAR